MSVEKAIVNILERNLDEMRKNFSVSLSEKAIMKLDEKKVDIGQKYFGQVFESTDQLDEKTIASKKSSKGTKWKVKSKNSDDEGSEVEVRQGKRVADTGDYDRGARAFFMKSGAYENPKDMLRNRK